MRLLRSISKLKLNGLLGIGLSAVGGIAAHAAGIQAPIGVTDDGLGHAWAFVGGTDGNVWLKTNYSGSWAWQNLAPLNVSYGAGVLDPGNHPAAYAVGTDGNLYIIHQVGSSWSTVNIGRPSGVGLSKYVGIMQNTSNQPFVFFVGSDGNLWLAHNAGSWAWTNLHAPPGVTVVTGIGATNVYPSYPQIFIIASDGGIYRASFNGSGYTWVEVAPFSGAIPLFATTPGGVPKYMTSPEVWVANSSGTTLYTYLWNGSGFTLTTSASPTSSDPVAVGMTINDYWPVLTDTLAEGIYFGSGVPGSFTWYTNNFYSTTGTKVKWPVGVEDPSGPGTGGTPYAFVVGGDGNLYEASYNGAVSNLGTP